MDNLRVGETFTAQQRPKFIVLTGIRRGDNTPLVVRRKGSGWSGSCSPPFNSTLNFWVKLFHPYAIYSVDVSADGQIIITGDSNGEIKFWDTDTLNLIWSISAYNVPIARVRLNETNDTLITISQATADVKLWRIPNGRANGE